MNTKSLRSGSLAAFLGVALLLPSDGTSFAGGHSPGLDRPVCGLDLGEAAIPDAAAWDAAFESRWGPIGPLDEAQVRTLAFGGRDAYDDSDARLAWIVHFWIRAFVVMADLTGSTRYLDAAVSLIETTLAQTDERRIDRGEIAEAYSRDPGYYRGTGKGGPFWKRGTQADVLDSGQIANGIMRFVDLILSQPGRFPAYEARAGRYLEEATDAVDAFDNDWQAHGAAGTYHYRDSEGSGDLGVTPVAFNQAATMMVAQLLIDRYRPTEARKDKVRRLALYWLQKYRIEHPDGTLSWPYIDHPTMTETEDTDHASIDVDFLVAAQAAGYTGLASDQIAALARTFLTKVYDGRNGLNAFVDGQTRQGYDENWNAALGWFELSAADPSVATAALAVFDAGYGPNSPPGVLWARPMLGWAKLLRAGAACP